MKELIEGDRKSPLLREFTVPASRWTGPTFAITRPCNVDRVSNISAEGMSFMYRMFIWSRIFFGYFDALVGLLISFSRFSSSLDDCSVAVVGQNKMKSKYFIWLLDLWWYASEFLLKTCYYYKMLYVTFADIISVSLKRGIFWYIGLWYLWIIQAWIFGRRSITASLIIQLKSFQQESCFSCIEACSSWPPSKISFQGVKQVTTHVSDALSYLTWR